MVKLVFRGKEYSVQGGMTLRKALEKCEFNPHMVLAVRHGKLVTEDVVLEDGDQIKLVAVVSGG
jgi:sulfur carrier protein ThiS